MEPLASEAFQPPHTLGRYEVFSLLGRGGMANVYLGKHTGEAGFQRLYAIKVLHPHLAEEEAFITMLFEEAGIAARLHHPNVVPIVDLGSQNGIHYVVMEYVEGCALSVLLRKSPNSRPPRLLIPIILDALNGLHAAHSLVDDDGRPMHLVHRDVSPQNILVGTNGTAHLTDFGIAKAESRITSTRPGEVKGKVLYMSPEQIRGGPDVDCRADVFSVGVLLWTSLTGQQLFQAPTDREAFTAILRKKIDRPSTVGLKPPSVLDAICLRALERDRNRRPSSALELEEALRAVSSANGLLGSKREVAEWVVSATGSELVERALAVRSISGTVGRSEFRVATFASQSSREADADPFVPIKDGTENESRTAPRSSSEMLVPGQVDGPSTSGSAALIISQLTKGVRPRRSWLLYGAAFVTLVGGVTTLFLVASHGSPKQAAAMPSAALKEPTTLPAARAAQPSTLAAPAAGSISVVETVSPPPQNTASATVAVHASPPRRSRERGQHAQSAAAAGGPEARIALPRSSPDPTGTSTATPSPPPTTKKPPIWDNDSPVPPQ